jgi:uridine kinase
MECGMIGFDQAVSLLRRLPDGLIAIDGLPVSGKSTLAERLENELGAVTIYLDDFVRPPAEWRGVAKPAFPFPYIRYDEFFATVKALAHDEAARYRRYDWETGRLAAWREVRPEGLVVIEGVSALHPVLAPLYDLRFWIESDAETTLAASLARGAGDWEREWRDLFMPSVALYLATDPRGRADHLVAGRGAGAQTQP